MGKTEEDKKIAKELEKSLISIPSTSIGTSVPNASKMPKYKSMPKATDKPSVFFKKSELNNNKKSSIKKLEEFLENKRLKK